MSTSDRRVPDTSLGLLGRVQAGDSDAWRDFSLRCFDVIHDWCRWRQMHGIEPDDITQNTMLVVVRKIGSFQHAGRGSLRAWLKAIAWRCWADAVARAKRSELGELRMHYEAAIDEIANLERQHEQLRKLDLMKRALLLVQQRVRPSTWQMFYRTALAGEAGATVSSEMKIPLYVIYSARARVQRLLHEEVQLLSALEPEVDVYESQVPETTSEPSGH
jgi:RNA polymerase sigma-70 factor (ECF subfamily)